jgi:hypothetical protein
MTTYMIGLTSKRTVETNDETSHMCQKVQNASSKRKFFVKTLILC